MKRGEEIENAAYQKYPYIGGTKGFICETSRPIFIQGAEWADKTMIEKVEKYLRAKIILYTFATTVDQREEWFNDFRKAMEE